VSDLLVGRIKERRNLEALLTESWVVGERQPEISSADNRDTQPPVEPQDLTEVTAELLDVVADAPDAEFTEVCEIFSNLCRVEMELLGQSLR
jgi:hypothetical protein